MRRLLVLLTAGLTACSGPSLIVLGEGVPPAPPQPELEVVVTDATGEPVAGAEVSFGSFERVTSDEAGKAAGAWPRQAITVVASAEGFHDGVVEVPDLPASRIVRLGLEPVILAGTVTTADGYGLPGALVSLDGRETMTGADGSFQIVQAVPGLVEVVKTAFDPVSVEWDGDAASVTLTTSEIIVRSLRASGPAAGNEEVWRNLLELAEESAINAIVVDTKDESGRVFHDTAVEEAHTAGAVARHYDIDTVLADLEERNLYAITRIVTFQDSFYGAANPELTIWDSGNNAPWQTSGGELWLDATDRMAWEYPLALGLEACEAGFDEIQYDYVRFPTDGPVARAVFDQPNDAATRVATISAFLEEARTRLNPLGCAVAADVFSVILSASGDQGLGQQVEALADSVDVISPMIYPSHYSTGWFGYDCPNDFPGEVVGLALDDGLPRVDGPAVVRPWIQDFTFGCGRSYGEEEVRAQIGAAESRDLGWILWNAGSTFTERALDPPPE